MQLQQDFRYVLFCQKKNKIQKQNDEEIQNLEAKLPKNIEAASLAAASKISSENDATKATNDANIAATAANIAATAANKAAAAANAAHKIERHLRETIASAAAVDW